MVLWHSEGTSTIGCQIGRALYYAQRGMIFSSARSQTPCAAIWKGSSRSTTRRSSSSLLPDDLRELRSDHALLLARLRHLERDQLHEALLVAPALPLAVEAEGEVLA